VIWKDGVASLKAISGLSLSSKNESLEQTETDVRRATTTNYEASLQQQGKLAGE
jgi:hypothetical protein